MSWITDNNAGVFRGRRPAKGQPSPWRNWSGSVQCAPQQVASPDSVDELARLMKACSSEGRHARVVGSGHSFSPLVETDDLLISLERFQGIEQVETQHNTVAVCAGTTLRSLGATLHACGLAQENLGGINAQTLAGAISTGTHGTGIRFGSMSTQIAGLSLVTAAGELLECSPEYNPELFKAAQVSLGALGIITKVRLRVVPARRLRVQTRRERLQACLASLQDNIRANAHFEFFWFPGTPWVQTRFLNDIDAPVSGRQEALPQTRLASSLYRLLSECCRLIPRLSRSVSTISALAAPNADHVAYSHDAFVAPLLVPSQAMEYALPVEQAETAVSELVSLLEKRDFRVHVPLGVRFVRGDDIWLSPAFGRDSVYIAAHMYWGMRFEPYFRQVEAILQRYGGRPHWGKIHTMEARELAGIYPRWCDFQSVRKSLDPEGVFLNDYLLQILDPDPPLPFGEAGRHSDIAGREPTQLPSVTRER